jgi:hypothetical protein
VVWIVVAIPYQETKAGKKKRGKGSQYSTSCCVSLVRKLFLLDLVTRRGTFDSVSQLNLLLSSGI